MRALYAALVLLLCTVSQCAFAVQPDEILPDSKLELRARELSKHLRCMVFQNQSIDDSDASLARDLRILVRERLQAGDSDQQVLDFLTARYGEFVLLRPRLSLHTALLWLTPIGLLLVGGFGLFALSRRRPSPEADLTAGERARVADIVRNEPQAN